ncbi:hypothetical protein D3C75_1098380 [compost metagenome]
MSHGGKSGGDDFFRAISSDEVLNESDRGNATRCNDLGYQACQQLFITSSGENLYAFSSQRFNDCPAQALARTSYQCSFTSDLQIHDQTSLNKEKGVGENVSPRLRFDFGHPST